MPRLHYMSADRQHGGKHPGILNNGITQLCVISFNTQKVGGPQKQCNREKHKKKSPCHELNAGQLAHNQTLNYTSP